MSFHTFMQMSAFVTYITRITQVPLKTVSNTLLILQLVAFVSFLFSTRLIFRQTNTDWIVVCTFKLRSLSCFVAIFSEIWS